MDGPRRSGDLCRQRTGDSSVLARVVGRNCNIELIIEDIRTELAGRPYELVAVAGGWQHRTKKVFGDAIHAAFGTAAARGQKSCRSRRRSS